MSAGSTTSETPGGAGQNQTIITLDLEGTLISNAVSVYPRPGLCSFLTGLAERVDQIVLCTSVTPGRARDIVQLLADEGSAPVWFAAIPIVGDAHPKDLTLISTTATVLLVDDQASSVHPGQHDQWIPVAPYDAPYRQGDSELGEVLRRIDDHLT